MFYEKWIEYIKFRDFKTLCFHFTFSFRNTIHTHGRARTHTRTPMRAQHFLFYSYLSP